MHDPEETGNEKPLPCNIEAEQAVLGTIINSRHFFDLVQDKLTPEMFYRKSHQIIYSALRRLHTTEDTTDYISLMDLLARKNRLQAVGGEFYITGLMSGDVPHGKAEYYADLVQKKYVFRQLLAAAAEIAACAYAEEDNALELAEQAVYKISQSQATTDLVGGSQVWMDYINRLDERNRKAVTGQIVGISTEFHDLDQLLGGLQPGELYVLGGRPGEGKTSLLLNFVLNLILKKLDSIAIFSLEMSRNDLANRLVSMVTGIDSQFLRTRWLDNNQWDQVTNAGEILDNERWFVDESGSLSIPALRTKCRRHKSQHGLDLVIVDYLQLMEAEELSHGKKQYNRTQEIGEISRGLKQLAKDLDVPVIAAAQLNRAVESRKNKRPQLSDLREGGSIEADADLVMFITRCKNPGLEAYSIVDIAKHRNGPVGEVVLRFEAPYTKFRDIEPGEVEIEKVLKEDKEQGNGF